MSLFPICYPEALYKDREGQHFWWGNILEPWQAHPENRPVEPVPNEAIYAPWRQSLWSLQEPTWRRKVPMITCVSEFFRRVWDSFCVSTLMRSTFHAYPPEVSQFAPEKFPKPKKKPDRLPTIGGVFLATKPQRVHEELLKSKGCQFGFHNGDLDLNWAMR